MNSLFFSFVHCCTHRRPNMHTDARTHTEYTFMECLSGSSASASRHALHLCPVCGLEAYYPLSSKWPPRSCTSLSISSAVWRVVERDTKARFMRKNDRAHHSVVLVIAHYACILGTTLSIVCRRACWSTVAVCPSVHVSNPLIFCRL